MFSTVHSTPWCALLRTTISNILIGEFFWIFFTFACFWISINKCPTFLNSKYFRVSKMICINRQHFDGCSFLLLNEGNPAEHLYITIQSRTHKKWGQEVWNCQNDKENIFYTMLGIKKIKRFPFWSPLFENKFCFIRARYDGRAPSECLLHKVVSQDSYLNIYIL